MNLKEWVWLQVQEFHSKDEYPDDHMYDVNARDEDGELTITLTKKYRKFYNAN